MKYFTACHTIEELKKEYKAAEEQAKKEYEEAEKFVEKAAEEYQKAVKNAGKEDSAQINSRLLDKAALKAERKKAAHAGSKRSNEGGDKKLSPRF